jgi:hypothetical protein
VVTGLSYFVTAVAVDNERCHSPGETCIAATSSAVDPRFGDLAIGPEGRKEISRWRKPPVDKYENESPGGAMEFRVIHRPFRTGTYPFHCGWESSSAPSTFE